MMNKYFYPYVDYTKFVLSIFVVCLHTGFLKDSSFYQYICPLLFRIGVPYFFIASGFFLGRKIYNNHNNFPCRGIVLNYCKRLGEKLITFELVSIVLRTIIYILSGYGIVRLFFTLLRSVIFYPGGGLWYVQASIIASIIMIPFVRKGAEHYALILGIVLYCIGSLANTYYFLIDNSRFQNMVDLYLKVCLSARNGLFVGLMYISAGILIAKFEDIIRKISFKVFCILGSVFYFFYLLEIRISINSLHKDDNSLYLMLPLVAVILFICTIRSVSYEKNVLSTFFKNLSTSIYFLHPETNYILTIVITCGINITDSYLVRTIAVFSIMCFLIILIYKNKNSRLYRICT